MQTPPQFSRLEALRLKLTQPGWQRVVIVRRSLAGILAVAACAVAVIPHDRDMKSVVIVRDTITAGSLIDKSVLEEKMVPSPFIPADAVPGAMKAQLAGRIAATRLTQNRIITRSDLVDPAIEARELSRIYARPRLASFSIDNAQAAGMVVRGDNIAIVEASASKENRARTIAARATVVTVTKADERSQVKARILVILDEDKAKAVAAATIDHSLAIVVAGQRTRSS